MWRLSSGRLRPLAETSALRQLSVLSFQLVNQNP